MKKVEKEWLPEIGEFYGFFRKNDDKSACEILNVTSLGNDEYLVIIKQWLYCSGQLRVEYRVVDVDAVNLMEFNTSREPDYEIYQLDDLAELESWLTKEDL